MVWIRIFFVHNYFFFRRNIYSDDLLKTLYVDTDLNHIKETDTSASADPQNSSSNQASGQKEPTVYDQKNGVRCIRISPDGKHLASGDRYVLHTVSFDWFLSGLEWILYLEFCLLNKTFVILPEIVIEYQI